MNKTTENKPKIRMGKNMSHALEFVTNNAGWHSYSKLCYSTIQAIRLLEKHGLVETNEFYQFRKAQR